MTSVFVSLGSNYHRQRNIKLALQTLGNHFDSLKISPAYQSEPINGYGEAYFNLCVGFTTDLSPAKLKELFTAIEQSLGRDRNTSANVSIDIDLLLYGNLVTKNDELTLPHPDIARYAHVLVPLLDIAPDLVMPDSGESLQQLCQAVQAERLKPIPLT